MRFTSTPTTPTTPTRQRGAFNMGCLLAVLLVLVAGGVGVFFCSKASMDVLSDAVREALEVNPVIVERVGEIQGFEVDFLSTRDSLKEEQFVFRIQGSKGSGKVRLKVRFGEPEANVEGEEARAEIVSGSLEMIGGETYDLLPEAVIEVVPEVVPEAVPGAAPEGD